MASDAGGVPGIPWHHIPAPWGTALCSTGCVMTQILTIAWSPGRTCVSGPCLTYPPSTVETTQQSIKHIHHQLWKQHNSQSNIFTINCGNNTKVNKQHNSQSNIFTINCGNNTTVNQTYPPSVETTQQSIKYIHHQLWKQDSATVKHIHHQLWKQDIATVIKHIHHQLWKQLNNQSNISAINCGNNSQSNISTINHGNNTTTVNQTYPPRTVETTRQSNTSTINCQNNTVQWSVRLSLPSCTFVFCLSN